MSSATNARVALAVFFLIVVAGLAIASFAAGWILHEQHDRRE